MHSFTARELKFSRPAVWLVTLMILCENSYTTISRTVTPTLSPLLLAKHATVLILWCRLHPS